ncbi:hypothetical protein [Pontibacter harenae]|uniref:hypothetical protein n=1 Tax=Pontibacter harenae TaxID=2894083 RepID=UPI001E59758F|nr:hypothetical protein [Pontibacter harenae]MCC9168893.1 hypothetical protein [Pontibacter harenae]
MGKRQVRIFKKDILNNAMELIFQPSVQLVQRNKVVVQGKLLSLNDRHAELRDSSKNIHTVPLEQVEEIVFDREAAW